MTESPFINRHCCWFCGEPNKDYFTFPPASSATGSTSDNYYIIDCPHIRLSVPSCGECNVIARKSHGNSIWAIKASVKRKLLKIYSKDLAIGINWTKEELATSEFEHGNFAGFAKSAWFMYEIAKDRISYIGWPLVVNGIELDEVELEDEETEVFSFDGVNYPSLLDAISHYAEVFYLEPEYLSAVVEHLGQNGVNGNTFAQAIRFSRLLINATSYEKLAAFKKLVSEM